MVDALFTAYLTGAAQTTAYVEKRGVDLPRPEAFAEFQGDEPVDPEEAIAWITKRAPMPLKRLEGILDVIKDKARENTQTLADTIASKIDEKLVSELRQGASLDEFLKNLDSVADTAGLTKADPFYWETVFRTNTQTAYGAGREEIMDNPAVKEAFGYVQYLTVDDSAVRPEHAALHEKVFKEDSEEAKRFWPPNGFNSFAADTRVSGIAEAASKAMYTGPMVEIKTRLGARLTVTVNHPILTPAGFVAAGDLKKGQNLLVHFPTIKALVNGSRNDGVSFPFISGGTVHDQEPISRIENIFKAFLSHGATSVFPGCGSLDFHGDGRFMYGDIYVVRPDSRLPRDADSAGPKTRGDGFFMKSTDPPVAFNHAESVPSPACLVRFGPASELDIPAPKAVRDCAPRNAKFAGDLQNTFPGKVIIDDVVSIELQKFNGHVFDLQSPNGIIVAEGIITSNCRCIMVPISREEIGDEGLEVSDGPPSLREGYERLGLEPPDDSDRPVAPDEGFEGRPSERFGTREEV